MIILIWDLKIDKTTFQMCVFKKEINVVALLWVTTARSNRFYVELPAVILDDSIGKSKNILGNIQIC